MITRLFSVTVEITERSAPKGAFGPHSYVVVLSHPQQGNTLNSTADTRNWQGPTLNYCLTVTCYSRHFYFRAQVIACTASLD